MPRNISSREADISHPVESGDKPNDSFVDYFEQQEILYEAGARNFMFIDVPPVYRAPWCKSLCTLPQQATANSSL